MSPENWREEYAKNYNAGLWRSLRGNYFPNDPQDLVLDAPIPTLQKLRLEPNLQDLRGEIINLFKGLGGARPNKNQAEIFRSWSKEVALEFPEAVLLRSTGYLNYVREAYIKGNRAKMWSYEVPIISANNDLWEKVQGMFDYNDPENL